MTDNPSKTILGICVTSSVLRVLLSGFWVSGLQVSSSKDQVLESLVSGPKSEGQDLVYQGPGSQDPGSRVRVSGPRVLGLRVPGLGS